MSVEILPLDRLEGERGLNMRGSHGDGTRGLSDSYSPNMWWATIIFRCFSEGLLNKSGPKEVDSNRYSKNHVLRITNVW